MAAGLGNRQMQGVLGKATNKHMYLSGNKIPGTHKEASFLAGRHRVSIVLRHSWIEKEKLGPGLGSSDDHDL